MSYINRLRAGILAFVLLTGIHSILAQDSSRNVAILNHQALFVMDLKKAADFYKNIIGLPQIEEPFKIGKHVWLKTGPHTSLHLILGSASKKEYYKNHHICFSVPSLEVFIEKLTKNNLDWEDAGGKKRSVTTRPDGIRQLWLQDPDGYWLEINNDQQGLKP